jgi:hypothetical protein
VLPISCGKRDAPYRPGYLFQPDCIFPRETGNEPRAYSNEHLLLEHIARIAYLLMAAPCQQKRQFQPMRIVSQLNYSWE